MEVEQVYAFAQVAVEFLPAGLRVVEAVGGQAEDEVEHAVVDVLVEAELAVEEAADSLVVEAVADLLAVEEVAD